VRLVDDLGTDARLFAVKRIRRFCEAIAVGDGAIRDPALRLLCYDIAPAVREPKAPAAVLHVNNRFGALMLEVGAPSAVCLPSTVAP
jgi:hypothetical protein